MDKRLIATTTFCALCCVAAQAAETGLQPSSKSASGPARSGASAQLASKLPRQGTDAQASTGNAAEKDPAPKQSVPGRKRGNVAGSCITFRDATEKDPTPKQSITGRKQGDVAGSCIPMREGVNRGLPFVDDAKPGQKRGTARSDCDPAIAPRGDATRVDPNRPDLNGSRIRTDRGDIVDRDLSGLYRNSTPRGRVQVDRPPNAAAPGEAIERGKDRADRERERQRAKFEEAIENAVYGNWDKCFRKFLDPETGDVFWDDSQCKR